MLPYQMLADMLRMGIKTIQVEDGMPREISQSEKDSVYDSTYKRFLE